MRPLQLEISAFGPYKSVVKIPMKTLGDSGIYLITGATGAGKTTIFDAISFALFGEPSGDVREPRMLRCKEADDNVLTYVKLQFLLKGKEYIVYRVPRYEKVSKRSKNGFTENISRVKLEMPEGNTIEKIDEANAKIIELIGLDQDQFRKIAMIAQGDFMKLLLADTTERREIFRKIFSTNLFSTIQSKISKDAATAKSDAKYYREIFENTRSKIDINEFLNDEEVIEEVKNLLEENKNDYLKHEKNLNETNLNLEKQKLLQEKDFQKKSIGVKIQEIENILINLKNENNLLEKKTKSLPFLNKKTHFLISEVSRVESRLSDYQHLEELEHSIITDQKEFVLISRSLNLAKAKIKFAKDKIELDKKIIEQHKNLDVLILRNDNELVNLKEKENALLGLLSVFDRYKGMQIDYKKKLAVYNDSQQKYNDAMLKEKNAEMLFFASLAGILSENLIVDMPCPVCGSKDHPVLATKPPETPSENELKIIRDNTKIMRDKMEINSNDCSAVIAKGKEMLKTLNETVKIVLGDVKVDEIEDLIASNLKDINLLKEERYKQSLQLKKDFIAKTNAEKDLLDFQLQLEKMESENVVNITKQSVCETRGKAATLQRDTLLQKLEYKSLELAQEFIETQNQNIDKINDLKNKIETNWNNNKNIILKTNSSLETLKNQLDSIGEIPDDLCENINILETYKKEILQNKENVFSKIQMYEVALKDLYSTLKKLKLAEERASWLSNLDNTASGGLNKVEKLNFETYVQISYFEMVINASNLRFRDMTQGRYELRRRQKAENLKQQTGLDLDVYDYHTSSLRSIKTLSGGESFKASLCMALGLSDVISACSGGIKIDTLFVDEGFGSLDSDSLDVAVKILSSLSEHGKLVGIISHVATLRDNIEKKIIVDAKGSGVQISI